MGTYYKRATSTATDVLISKGSWFRDGSVAITTTTLAGRLSDQTDATFIWRDNFASTGRLYLRLESALRATLGGATGASVPATEAIRSITPVIRTQSNSIGDVDQPRFTLELGYVASATGCVAVGYNPAKTFSKATAVAENRIAAPTTTRYSGGPAWTRDDVNSPTNSGLVVRLEDTATASVSAAPRFLDLWAVITTTSIPTVTVDAPADPVTDTLTPTITWTYSDADGESQTYYSVKVYSAAQYSAGGFSPDTSTPTLPSGIAPGNVASWTATTPLSNGVTYRAYVRVAKDNAGTKLWSAWAYREFTISVNSPSAPLIIPSWDTTNQRAVLTVGPQPLNRLTAADANLETGIGSWVDFANNAAGYPQRVNTVAKQGTWSLALRSNVAGPVALAATTWPVTAYPVTAGATYLASMWVRSAVNARPAAIKVIWYTSGSVYINEVDSFRVMGSTSGWTQVVGVFTAPSPIAPATTPVAAYALIVPVFYETTNAVGEIHYVDQLMFAPVAGSFQSNLRLSSVAPAAAAVRTNMVPDPSFNTIATWGGSGTGFGGSLITTDGYAGPGCFRVIRGSAAGQGVYVEGSGTLPIVPGATYGWSGYFKVPADFTGETTAFRASIQWWNGVPYAGGSTVVSSSNGTDVTVTAAMGWTRASVQAVAPATATHAFPFLSAPNAGTDGKMFLIDAALFEPLSILPNGNFNTDTAGWTPSNSTLAVTTTSPYYGAGSLQITSNGSTGSIAYSDRIAVEPGQSYFLSAYAKNISGTTRNMQAFLQWITDAGTFISNSTTINWTNLAAGGAWTAASGTYTAPATARYVQIYLNGNITGTTAGWQSGFDNVEFGPSNAIRSYFDGSYDNGELPGWTGTVSNSISKTFMGWHPGGITYNNLSITRTDSQGTRLVRALPNGSGTPVSATGLTAYQAGGVFYDYEAPRGETLRYFAASTALVSGVSVSASTGAYSLTTTNDGTNWLKPIYAPTLSDGGLLLKTNPQFTIDEEVGVFKPRGRGYQIVVSGGLYGTSGSFEITTPNATDAALLEAILEHKGVLLWQDPYGGHRWIRLTKRAYTQTGPTSRQVRVFTCDYVEVGPD